MENQELIKQVTEKAQRWLTPAYDAETQAEVKRMLENEDKTELIDCFYKDLEFGTGGLRGIMGAGTNRMNIYTVGAATQGLSNYLNKCFKDKEQISVVVGYDCRNNSDKFARISADIFSANGIKVYLFDDLRPTRSASGSLAITISASIFFANAIAIESASAFSGFGDTTVGKLPSFTICSGTQFTFSNPHSFREEGISTRPAPCSGV